MRLTETSKTQLNREPSIDLSIVIVCWNNKRYLEPCLNALFTTGLEQRFEVIVVDNGSSDGTVPMVREAFPQIRLIQNDANVGLSRASNQGIIQSKGCYVLLLNDDTLVNGFSLTTLVKFMDNHSDAGAVGGRLLNPDGSFQAGFAHFPSLWQEFLIATRLSTFFSPSYPSYGQGDEVREVDWLSSACLLLRRSAIDEVGLLKEDYFIYADETDLQYRLKQAGWKVYFLPNVTTVHFGGRSLDRWRRRKMVYRGKLLFYQKNQGASRTMILRIMFAIITLAKLSVWALLFILRPGRAQARREVTSNLDVLRLCWKLV